MIVSSACTQENIFFKFRNSYILAGMCPLTKYALQEKSPIYIYMYIYI